MDANGLTANDAIQRGNEGIDIGAWTGAPTQTERPALPGTEHLIGVEYEPLPKPAWLTERRADLAFYAIAAPGIAMGVLSWL